MSMLNFKAFLQTAHISEYSYEIFFQKNPEDVQCHNIHGGETHGLARGRNRL